MSDTGAQGEKGEQGKQGIEGIEGQIGKMGLKGNQGNRGNPGAEGPEGKSAPNPYRRLLIMYVFMAVMFALLAYRTETSAHNGAETTRLALANTERLDAATKKIAELQTRTSTKVLCPLYELFLASVAHPQPEQVDTPDERRRFDDAVQVIRDGYTTLGCKPILR